MIAWGLGLAIYYGKKIIFSKVGPILLGAVALGLAVWWVVSKLEERGYDRCKGEWDASVLQTTKQVEDGVARAHDDVNSGVPDPFDSDPGRGVQGDR